MQQPTNTTTEACATCGVDLHGKFCHACGEKQLRPERDLSARHFLTETFEHFTHLDSKLLRSVALLFARPGWLTAEFLAGRRVRYLKPLPLFVLAGVVFYLFFGKATSFFSNLGDLTRGYESGNWVSNTFQVNTGAILGQKAAAAQREPEAYWQEMATEAAHRSKAWLFVIAPVWGLALWPFFYRRNRWLVPHLIFALHGLAFFVLFDTVCLLVLSKGFGVRQLGDEFVLFLAVCFAVYNILAVRRVYQLNRWWSIPAGVWTMFLFLVVLVLYRQTITIWTLYTY